MPDKTDNSTKAAVNENQDPRIVLAAERTLLAWIRTGLALMGFGFVVARFGFFLRELASLRGTAPVQHAGLSQWAGTGLVLLSVAVTALRGPSYALYPFVQNRSQLPRPAMISLGTVLAAILAVLGIGMAAYLIVVH